MSGSSGMRDSNECTTWPNQQGPRHVSGRRGVIRVGGRMKRAGLVLGFSAIVMAGMGTEPLSAPVRASGAPAGAAVAAADAVQPDLDPQIVKLLGAISEDRLHQIIE